MFLVILKIEFVQILLAFLFKDKLDPHKDENKFNLSKINSLISSSDSFHLRTPKH
jgi:hypothetical protein